VKKRSQDYMTACLATIWERLHSIPGQKRVSE
jgi:hypothetical protein